MRTDLQWRRRVAAVLTAVAATIPAAVVAAEANPAPSASAPGTSAEAGTSYLDRVESRTARDRSMFVYSAAMDRVIELDVIRAADTSNPRPVLYLLNGAGGGMDAATWQQQTDVREFFEDKNVNVVIPVGGAFSYYTDWMRDDPELGRHRWTTFLTEELPPILDEALGASGRNAIAGLSMSGGSALALAADAPELYQAVGSYSGCPQTSSEPGRNYVELVVSLGGGDVENMWGPVGGPEWIARDVSLNAEKLRGKALYISSGGGLPGPHEFPTAVGGRGDVAPDPVDLAVLGSIEAAVAQCTDRFRTTLEALDIDATYVARPDGVHSWGYWEDALHDSWPMMAEAIGA